ncbi:EAL domain-containing protein [Synechococcus sp. PCC 7336]|uniref:sensor domain-containing protein n=1 Tax=Synechococcus sp. PCC 7336 TaxID=195250 RepID=UPI00034A903C|nr:EAL domain-containing protein [Synechococcus sp. PCC 7336]
MPKSSQAWDDDAPIVGNPPQAETEDAPAFEATELVRAAGQFARLFQYNPDGIAVTTITDRKILAVNPGFSKLTGYSREALVGRSMSALNLWVDARKHTRSIRSLNARGAHVCREMEFLTAEGQRRTGLVSVEIIEVKGNPMLLTIVRDVSQYKEQFNLLHRQQQQLKALNSLASAAFQSSSFEVALKGMVKSLSEVAGFPMVAIEQYIPDRQMMKFVAAEGVEYSDDTALEVSARDYLSGRAALSGEVMVETFSGDRADSAHVSPLLSRAEIQTAICLPIEVDRKLFGTLTLAHPEVIQPKPQSLDWLGKLGNAIATFSRRKQVAEQLRYSAFHDILTGLPNRALFLDRLEHSVRRAKRNPHYLFAILFLDLDGFKLVNDSLGHNMGDRLLVEAARRFATCLRPEDTLSRFGGDEFTLLLEDIQYPKDAIRVANRIQAKLAAPFELAGQEVFTSTSIGIVLWSSIYEAPDEMLRDADIAMYRAKDAGKSQHILFDPLMHQQAIEQLQLETDLRKAIAQRQLRVFYQPTISFRTGKIEGLEALVRWQHPQRGLLTPREFLPIAEDSTLVTEIDNWMLREVCQQLQQWQQQFPTVALPPISLNFSARQLQNPNLPSQVDRALNRLAISPRNLQIEFTEGAIAGGGERIAQSLQQLQKLGVRAAIDDFGTGYFSLTSLYGFPVDSLKIDRSFVSNIQRGGKSLSIVRSIATLAQQLGLSVTAEGIETSEQLSLLRAIGCESGQGYLFSQPLEGDRMWDLVTSNPKW